MKSLARAVGVLLLAGTVVALGTHQAQAAGPLLSLQTAASGLTSPIGVDAHVTNTGTVDGVLVSVNYVDHGGGTPNNFVKFPLGGGAASVWPSVSGLTDEISITTVKPGQPADDKGAWTVGDIFTPNGVPGQVVRIPSSGASATLFSNTGGTGLIRGEMALDRTGIFKNHLIAGNVSGQIYQIDSQGNATYLASIPAAPNGGAEIEGITVIPNDAAQYGTWAGKLLVSSPSSGLVYTVTTTGQVTPYNLGIATPRHSSDANPQGENDWESIHVIPAGADFYQIEYNQKAVFRLSAADLKPYVGKILLVEEFPARLWVLNWNGSSFDTTLLAQSTNPSDPYDLGNFEQGNFVPVLGSISGTLYYDINQNQQQDPGEPGIPGQTVTLTGPVSGTTTTDANGNYVFNNLPGGSYSIVAPTTTTDNKNLETTSPLTVNLPDGGNSTGNNFGYVLGTISGVVYNDLNQDKQLDNGEPGIQGITVTLLQNNVVVATTMTDGNGYYEFTNLPAGTYTVSSPATAAGLNLETQSPLTVVLPAGGNKPNNNFGYIAPAPPQSGPLYTATQGGWGQKPSGNNVGMFLKKNFAAAFPNGVTIGAGTKTATFTSQVAIQGFLPAKGNFSPFTTSYTNPTSTPAGEFAGQVLSATLAVGFANAGITNSNLPNVKPKSGPLAGLTISQILVEANKVLAGQSSLYSESDLNTVLDQFNNNYDQGLVNKGFFQ